MTQNILEAGDGVGGEPTCQPGRHSPLLPLPHLTLTTPGPHHQQGRSGLSVPETPIAVRDVPPLFRARAPGAVAPA
eukprot:12923745-Prorocentrum_lima.AAC.1